MYMKLDRNRRYWAVGAGVAVVVLFAAYIMLVDNRGADSLIEPAVSQETIN